ncbi:SMI1/KNR4 family protein [Maribacter ulvicola]|uniref:Knr4/Smi1-like domain-containing protein n=1 Tax=Maribacter ulvicola TaxID=228959 RepID=A0A1N6RPB2_9FLAO|nr:SMI1/KNR4 family protein [Maribacter ulvicola]SIQ30641.1 hypothetical protein SAMN05421797_1011353 [Maribacter ulvicola]
MKLEMSATFQQELPIKYLKFLEENSNGVRLKNNSRWDKRIWHLMGKEALLKKRKMSGVGEAANYECLKLYTTVQQEVGMEFTAPSTHFRSVKLERVAKGFVIGHENGDYLYLDPECKFTVWAYYHDGGEVALISKSFTQLLRTQKPL